MKTHYKTSIYAGNGVPKIKPPDGSVYVQTHHDGGLTYWVLSKGKWKKVLIDEEPR